MAQQMDKKRENIKGRKPPQAKVTTSKPAVETKIAEKVVPKPEVADAREAATTEKQVEGKKRVKTPAVVTADENWKRIKEMLPAPKPKPKVELPPKNDPIMVPARIISTATPGDSVKGSRGIVGLDCEMVGGDRGTSMLARVCIVDENGRILYDKFVRPVGKIEDYRTRYSGIKPHHLTSSSAVSFLQAQKAVAEMIQGKIVVGHSIKNDFKVLGIEHPALLVRDTALYQPFRSTSGHARKLKHLTLERLKRVIQDGSKGHDPADDAKAALDLYLKHRDEWEISVKRKLMHEPSKL